MFLGKERQEGRNWLYQSKTQPSTQNNELFLHDLLQRLTKTHREWGVRRPIPFSVLKFRNIKLSLVGKRVDRKISKDVEGSLKYGCGQDIWLLWEKRKRSASKALLLVNWQLEDYIISQQILKYLIMTTRGRHILDNVIVMLLYWSMTSHKDLNLVQRYVLCVLMTLRHH